MFDLKWHATRVLKANFSTDGKRIITATQDGTTKKWDANTGNDISNEPIPKVKITEFVADERYFIHHDRDRINLIPRLWNPREIEHRLFHTQPKLDRYQEGLENATTIKDSFAASFYLDRILSIPDQRTAERFQQRIDLIGNPINIARTSFHQPEFAKTNYDRETLAALAVAGDRMAQRLVAQERIRDGKPALAIPLLTSCMLTRPRNSPPVEDLLIAKAYTAMNDRPQAERFYRAATEWLERPKIPILAAEVITKSAINGWAALGEAFKPIDDPRHNPFDWESWHEAAALLPRE